MTNQDYPIYEEAVISDLYDNWNLSNIPLFVTNENLNLYISLGSSFDINGLCFSKKDARSMPRWNTSIIMYCIECINKLNGVYGFAVEIGYTRECNGGVGCNETKKILVYQAENL